MNNELVLRRPTATQWHPSQCCLAMWEEQKPVSSDDNHIIQCFAAHYLREKAVSWCHSSTGEYLLLSETQQEAGGLPQFLFSCSAWRCWGLVSIEIGIIGLFLIIFLSQSGKRSTDSTFWGAHASQMWHGAIWTTGILAPPSCPAVIYAQGRARVCCHPTLSGRKISEARRTDVKGNQENGLMVNAAAFLHIWGAWITSSCTTS